MIGAVSIIVETVALDTVHLHRIFDGILTCFRHQAFCVDVLSLFVSSDDELDALFSPENRELFCLQLCQLTEYPDLKFHCYLCWRRLAKSSFATLQEFLPSVIELAAGDLQSSEDRKVLLAALRFVKRVISCWKKYSIDCSASDILFSPLIRVMSLVPNGEPDEPDC
jgi:hypothetical protein